jgi:hypothetical protein
MAKNSNDAIKPTNDAYTGMLAISLLALIIGGVLLFLDYSQYSEKPPPAVPKASGIIGSGTGQQPPQN